MNNYRLFRETFPLAQKYASLKNPVPQCVRESTQQSKPFSYTERHIQCVWTDSRFRPASIITSDGESISVINPGRWNLEAGPDFIDAVLLIGIEKRRVQGDIELHIHPADWNSHGHNSDPRYNRIIAHVCYFPGRLDKNALPAGTVQISLRDLLLADRSFTFENIDVTAYPYAPVSTQTPPCGKIMETWTPEEKGALLEASGQYRLETKATRMTAENRNDNPNELIYEEIMCALGYKHNSACFRDLARRVPLEALKEEKTLLDAYALLLGVSGLIPDNFPQKWSQNAKAFMRTVWDSWWKQQAKWESLLMSRKQWRLSGVRPQNHPIRRMAAAIGLFANTSDFAKTIQDVSTDDAETWRKKMTAIFSVEDPTGFWSYQLGLSAPQREKPVALIGARRLSAILTNVVIPFLACTKTDISNLLKSLPPEQENTHMRCAAHALFGRDHNPALYNTNGLRQQGLMQIFHDFCLPDRTACKECPLPKSLQQYRSQI